MTQIRDCLQVAFVGPDEEFDKLYRRMVKLPQLRASPYVIYNLLAVKAAIAKAYGPPNTSPHVPNLQDVCALLHGLTEDLVASAMRIRGTALERAALFASSDVAHVRDPPTTEDQRDDEVSVSFGACECCMLPCLLMSAAWTQCR